MTDKEFAYIKNWLGADIQGQDHAYQKDIDDALEIVDNAESVEDLEGLRNIYANFDCVYNEALESMKNARAKGEL